MSILSDASRGVYGQGSTGQVGGMTPIWLSAERQYAFEGAMIDTQKVIGTGTLKVIDFYPKSIRTGTLISEYEKAKAVPMPTYRVVGDVSAAATKLTVLQGEGFALLVKGSKLQNDAGTEITVPNTITTDNDGNASITITANALGALKDGDVLILGAAADLIPAGLLDEDKVYDGVGNAFVDVRVADVGRIDGRLIAGILPSLWSKYLQTIKIK